MGSCLSLCSNHVVLQSSPTVPVQAGFSEEEALQKAARLHQLKHIFLYSLNPEHALIRWDEAYSVHPLDDAFTASMKALLRRACKLGMRGRWAH